MKKAILFSLVLILLVLLPILFLQCSNHDDLTEFTMADVSQITFEELLAPPYVTLDVWSFVDMWNIEFDGETLWSEDAEDDLYIEITDGLREILKEETLYTYIPEGNVKDYDQHIRELLWEHEKYPLYMQLSAGIMISGVEIGEEDLVPDMVHLYSLDGSRCYLTIGYCKGSILKRNHYVFYTDDPDLVNELFLFAENILARKKES